ncbi:MAG: N-acetyl-gamma-glutamyl-phosphate reductase [Candidatus Adiutrix sp.]|jgi:N-acetyl-gamma-glutamyl-phosphate reductase|nr:N-acetyl-gamma-glutamyl-phosphate reductase [Candidatus Adiutrix sp.]
MNVGIIGATGYTGLELLRLLAQHPAAPRVTVITSRQERDRPLTAVFPALSGLANYDQLKFEAPQTAELAGRADFFFLAAPHGAAMDLAPPILAAGGRIVDLSADFRLRDAEVFNQWYLPHSAPGLLSEAVYGLPELYAPQIRPARLVANPGCYPTSIILALAPFLKNGFLDASQPIIADACSGVSGAGRGALAGNSFCEVQDSFKAYKVVGHRHSPEIEQELSALQGRDLRVAFTPHLLPMNRGILATIYAAPQNDVNLEGLREVYLDFYRHSPFVRVRPSGFEPQTSEVRGTNFCDLSLFFDRRSGLVKIISAIDNLCRGASGQAVANFNLMCGRPESDGLMLAALRP